MTTTLAEYPNARMIDTGVNGHQPIRSVHPINFATHVEPSAPVEARTEPSAWWAVARSVAPLALVNGLAVYGQLAYVYERVAPHVWNQPSRLALAICAASAVESIALYVGWHAHDALLVKAHTTARNLRRTSYVIAGLVATVNYAHFAGPHLAPTAAAAMFGLVSLVSPWLWGLHSRRAQRIQLRKERRIDEAGAEFSPERRRNFPVRTWKARRWSIDHGVTDPREAWVGYNTERAAQAAAKAAAKSAQRTTAQPSGPAHDDAPTAPAQKRAAHRAPSRKRPPSSRRQPTRRSAQPSPLTDEAAQPTTSSPVGPVASAQPAGTPTAHVGGQPITELQRQRLDDLAHEFPEDLPGRDKVMAHMRERGYEGWSSKGPAQTVLDLLRAERGIAQPTPTKEAS